MQLRRLLLVLAMLSLFWGLPLGVAGAANTVWKASQDDATAEDKEEAMSYKEHRFRP